MPIMYFRSKAAPKVFLMPDTAKAVFDEWKMVQTKQGAIMPEDLPAKLEQLRELIARDDEEVRMLEEAARSACKYEEDREKVDIGRVSYRIRLWPLKDMIEKAIRKDVDIHWGF